VFNEAQFQTHKQGHGDLAACVISLAVDKGEQPNSCQSYFTPKESTPGTHLVCGWVQPRATVD
jgi:hypothetical protein